MTESTPPCISAVVHRDDSNSPGHHGQYPLSCTNCRQRKVKCNKIHPCSPCQRSGLDCVFPERVRHPKKKKTGLKTTNEELLARVNRMERLIGRMEGEGRSVREESPKPYSPPVISVPTQVEGLRQAVDDASDEDRSPFSSHSNSDNCTSHSSNIFGATLSTPRNLRLLHPPPAHIKKLSELCLSNVDAVFKVLHAPSLRKMVANVASGLDDIPTDNYVEPMLFAMYYAAITTLTNEQCLKEFQDGRDSLLAKYRAGTERALANADFLNTTELGTLQALSIFLITIRANDDSQYTWTLTAVAVRLAHALGLHREGMSVGMSPFMREMRRRLWWQLIVLDVRCCEDRASDPLISEWSFNTLRPLNINDSDISPEMTEPPVERVGFTEMSKCSVSHEVAFLKWRFGYMPPLRDDRGNVPKPLNFQEQMAMLTEVEKTIHDKVLVHCDPSNPIAWVASVIARLIMCRIRLVVYHPVEFADRPSARTNVSGEQLLETAVQVLEYSNLLDTEPAAAQWQWFFKTYVQWYTLATTLAELCVQSKGPLVERAWRIVDLVFDNWSARIADSPNGMLWRPMKKLMSKAQATRRQADALNHAAALQQQQPLPQFESLAFSKPDPSLLSPSSTVIPAMDNQGLTMLNPPFQAEQQLPSAVLAPVDRNESSGAINWAEWDAFMQDFETGDTPNDSDMTGMHSGPNHFGAWW
ncbi:MAG: hypothetical protein Q9217_000889 [Psora testacea]